MSPTPVPDELALELELADARRRLDEAERDLEITRRELARFRAEAGVLREQIAKYHRGEVARPMLPPAARLPWHRRLAAWFAGLAGVRRRRRLGRLIAEADGVEIMVPPPPRETLRMPTSTLVRARSAADRDREGDA
jgi:hypothetical protein